MSNRQSNFIQQQGFDAPPAESCAITYAGLQFQPRLIGIVTLIASLLQSPIVFLAMAAVLWWNALLPRWNVFDAIYNRFFARSGYRLQPAPPPRRFAQFLAGLLATTIAALLILGFRFAAILVEAFLLGAIAALLFGGFCLGSYAYHLLRGRKAFAHRTMPWSA